MGNAVINKWIAPLRIIKFDACNIYLEAKDTFQSIWLEEHILGKARTEFLNSNNHPIKIHIKVKNTDEINLNNEGKEKKTSVALEFKPDLLDENNTFSNFYEDCNNSLCVKFLSKLSNPSPKTEKNIDKNSDIELASLQPDINLWATFQRKDPSSNGLCPSANISWKKCFLH